ncbi:carbohydrate ABC transporter permease [soil metagenome]
MALIELAPPNNRAAESVGGGAAALGVDEPVSHKGSSKRATARAKAAGSDAVRASGSVGGHVLLTIVSFVSLAPVVWMYLTSIQPEANIFNPTRLLSVTAENYQTVFSQLQVPTLFANTVTMALLVALGQLITSLLAAYALARWNFRGQSLLFLAFIASWLVPFQVTMLPNYVLLSHLGLLNSLGGIIIPQLSSAYAVILLRQHLKSFPTELLDAAQIDGRSSWATLWRVVVPNMAPSIAALGILLFISAWNEYFWPFLIFRDPAKSVLQLGIQPFLGAESLDYGALMAVSGLACLPILIVYLVFQRRVVNAFVRSGLK